jgi:hypothetical protein
MVTGLARLAGLAVYILKKEKKKEEEKREKKNTI